jgi:sugar-specific transcriptional regulator TrmB
MLASPEVMDALKGIGLNLYERRLWVALLAKGVATAGELSAVANVPRSRSYDVLQTLADKGFVIIQTSKPLKYVAVAPKEALEKSKKTLEMDLEQKIERIDQLQSSYLVEELDSIHKQSLQVISMEDLTGALKGKYSVLQQMDSMLRDATSSISIVTNSTGLTDLSNNHLSVLKRLKDKGVNIRIALNSDGRAADAIKTLSGVAEIRDISSSPAPISGNFYVVDGKQLSMGLSDPEQVHTSQYMMFWTKSQHAAKNIGQPIFDLIWSQGKNIGKKG